jgi:hypothetical protein
LIFLCGSTVRDPALACCGEAVSAGLTDGLSAALVFVVEGDVSDRGVQPNGVVFGSHTVQFGFKCGGLQIF